MQAQIRLADPDGDAAGVAGVYRPAVEGSVASFETAAPDAAEMATRMRAVLERAPWLVATEGSAILGYAYAGITLPNPASVALHESIGMRLIGVYERVGWKFGAWHDVAWYGMRLGEPEQSPSGEPAEPASTETSSAKAPEPAFLRETKTTDRQGPEARRGRR